MSESAKPFQWLHYLAQKRLSWKFSKSFVYVKTIKKNHYASLSSTMSFSLNKNEFAWPWTYTVKHLLVTRIPKNSRPIPTRAFLALCIHPLGIFSILFHANILRTDRLILTFSLMFTSKSNLRSKLLNVFIHVFYSTSSFFFFIQFLLQYFLYSKIRKWNWKKEKFNISKHIEIRIF